MTLVAEDPAARDRRATKKTTGGLPQRGESARDTVQAKVLNAARKMQQAEQEGRPAILILEIGPGN